MKNLLKTWSVLLSLVAFIPATSYSASLFVPMQHTELNQNIERLFILTDAHSMNKPFAVDYVNQQLKKLGSNHTELKNKISNQLRQLTNNNVSFAKASVNYTTSINTPSAKHNSLGEFNDSNGNLFASSSHNLGDYFAVNAGISAVNSFSDVNPYESFVSMGTGNIQLDLGFKQHWLSPFQTRAMLVSNNAKNTLSATLSNPVPYKKLWNLQYNVFLQDMEKHDKVLIDGTYQTGNPYLLGTQISFSPLNNLHISLNRAFQFGGRGKDITLEQVWNAFTDAVGSDNSGEISCHGQSAVNCEFGNQRASVQVKMHFPSKIPFSIYGEFAGEDAASHSNFLLGNIAVSAGVHVSSIKFGKSTYSFTYESTEYQSAWHLHHIYKSGFRINEISTGHWGTNHTSGIENASGVTHSARISKATTDFTLITELDLHQNKLSPGQGAFNYDYATAFGLKVSYISRDLDSIKYHLSVNQNAFNQSYYSLGLTWQL